MVRRELAQRKLFEEPKGAQETDTEECQSSTSAAAKNTEFKTPAAGPSVKTEHTLPRSKGQSDTSSVKARKAQLHLDAAKQKAQIQLELIDKQLEADLAELEEEEKYSPHEERAHDVEQWLERSHHELMQSAPDHGNPSGKLHPPETGPAAPANAVIFKAPAAPPGLTTSHQKPAPSVPHLPMESHPHTVPVLPPAAEATSMQATIQILAGALKDLTSTSAPNTNLLTRLSTPKDLPDFSGDPLEFLQFKQAYNESTELCKFSPEENLWRLRKCLRGAAKDAVAALLISASPPCKIMSTLELRFGNADLIISKIVQDIKKLPSMSQNYHSEIVPFSVKVQNLIQAVRAVGREEYLQGMSIVSIILSKLPTTLLSKWSDYSFPLITEGQKSRMVILSDFLHDEAVKISVTSNIYFTSPRTDQNKNNHQKNKDSSGNRSQTILLQTNDDTDNCKFCRTSKHKLTECKQFKKALRKTRWEFVKRNGICYKCLLSRHARDTCSAPPCDKNSCGEGHHNLLHYVGNKPKNDAESSQVPEPRSTPVPTLTSATASPTSSADSTQTVTHINASENKVLLKVVPIRIHSANGVFSANALLDDGSTVSLISAGLAKRAGLRGRSETMRIRGAWSDDELVCKTTIANVKLSGMDNKMYNIELRCVDKLDLPLQQLSVIDYSNYKNVFGINDKILCKHDVKPEILIGQDNCHLLLPLKVIVGKLYEPSATLTPLGWCMHGMLRRQHAGHAQVNAATVEAHATLLLSSAASTAAGRDERRLRDLHEEVRQSFAVDALGVSGKPRQNINETRAVELLEKSVELVNGRWHVCLPWKNEACTMPDTYPNALKRLKGIERKMARDHGFAERYRERINHLLQNDYAHKMEKRLPALRTWYLPHFGVDNPNKKSLRLVFDSAAPVGDKCLNDYLLTGPDLLSSLFGIMLRFREYSIAVTGDIKDMFLRVKIRPEDQHAFRFLWRNSPDDPVDIYVMTSLIFGANCSPFVAQFVKNVNARRYESTLPAAVNAIYKSHYMDDYIDSLPDDTAAIEMVKNITEIHSSGGFQIRNWTSNSIAVLDSVPKDTLGSASVRFKFEQEYHGERTLGLIWYPGEDELGFDVSLKRIPENIILNKDRPTKRIMLRIVMSIFDVLGFLAPFTIQGKIMLQDTWRLNIGWDDVVPDSIYNKWCKWIELLKDIKQIRIPRCYNKTILLQGGNETEIKPVAEIAMIRPSPPAASPATSALELSATSSCYETCRLPTTTATSATPASNNYTRLQLHLFCDASIQAMCCVAYWRWIVNGIVYVAFIASKCRVVPVKPMTVPRAELQAALLAARLADNVLKEHRLAPEQRYFWCDSTTVLQWIRNNTRRYKTFEANRLGEIDELTRISEWRYVPTKLNVADLGTRDEFNHTMFHSEWFTGPDFLHKVESLWPADVVSPDIDRDEGSLECVALMHEPTCNLPVPEPQRFSSWLRLQRATAVILKFIDRCKRLTGEVDCDAMARAEILLLKKVQVESFSAEISAIKNGKHLSRDSKLLTLSPYLDETGLLRLGGRIDAATDVDLETKRPIILDGKHDITRLLVMFFHIKAAHGNQEMVVNNLKQKFWIIKIRPTVKRVVSKCMLCRIRKCKPQVPRMGDLPHARVAHHQQPFSFCGLDLFGPMEVTVGRGRQKRYGVLFTCLTIRAVHIELVPSLTSDSLIMALRRMAARRGWPCHLYSDNGTNLRASDKELKQSEQALNIDALKAAGANNAMQWHFIPPSSPHWGGAWERLIRSVKTSLRVIMKERAPREEVLLTLIAEVENMVNSRPLTHVSVDPESLESLTPNHFLLGSSSSTPIVGTFDDSDMFLRKQWRKSQALADMFWRRWVKEVLPELLPRRKWNEEVKPLQVGDVVLVADPNGPRSTWPKGVIQKICPGKDGRIRLVEVKTKTGVWKRPAARVARISLVEEC